MKLTKAFHFSYRGYEIKIALLKNEIGRWYVEGDKVRRSFAWSSDKLRVKAVVKEAKRFIDAKERKLGIK